MNPFIRLTGCACAPSQGVPGGGAGPHLYVAQSAYCLCWQPQRQHNAWSSRRQCNRCKRRARTAPPPNPYVVPASPYAAPPPATGAATTFPPPVRHHIQQCRRPTRRKPLARRQHLIRTRAAARSPQPRPWPRRTVTRRRRLPPIRRSPCHSFHRPRLDSINPRRTTSTRAARATGPKRNDCSRKSVSSTPISTAGIPTRSILESMRQRFRARSLSRCSTISRRRCW